MVLGTPDQSKKLHTLLTKMGIDDDNKRRLVRSFSYNRTETSKELSMSECAALIKALEESKNTADQQHALNEAKLLEKARWALRFAMRDHWNMKTPDGKPDNDHIDKYTLHYWHKVIAGMDMGELNKYIAIVKKQ